MCRALPDLPGAETGPHQPTEGQQGPGSQGPCARLETRSARARTWTLEPRACACVWGHVLLTEGHGARDNSLSLSFPERKWE